MHLVESFLEGGKYRTDVWAATERVLRPMLKLKKKKPTLVHRFVSLIDRCAQRGFDRMPANVIRHEGNGVYAIGDRHGPLLRASGFFDEGHDKPTFVLMDFYEKHGQKLREPERGRIAEVARIRDQREWVKVNK
ncbi:MAG: hypothetical protein IID38_02745 [Planctomycetes bacterium]|nr:hypothetical protein [Planctomycetota bacterium]